MGRLQVTDEKTKLEVISYFLRNKNNSQKQMSEFFGIPISIINKVIDEYLFNKKRQIKSK